MCVRAGFGLLSFVWFFLRFINMTICSNLLTLAEPISSFRKVTSQLKVENRCCVNAYLP